MLSNKNIKCLFVLLAVLVTVAGSCKKFVEIAPPVSEIENSEVFSNDQATISAALGVYSNMGASSLYICSGGMTLYPALSSDELVCTSSNAELLSFQNNTIIANNGTGIYTRLWVPAYTYIYAANAVLEGIEHSGSPADSVKRQIEGEMLVVRALNYFSLVNLFGDVPLELTTDYVTNSVMPRTTVDQIYNQLIADLLKAESLLTTDYPSGLKARPNKWTATALLARIYLYKKDWTNAELKASDIINSNNYGLEADLNNVFSQSSNETIWQLASDYHNTAEGLTFIPTSASSRPSFAITPFLLSAFEPDDMRVPGWLNKNIVGGKTYYYPFKYKIRTSQPVSEYYVVFRLAEQYLIRSEARAALNDLENSKADLNIIRSRSGLQNTPASDRQSLLTAIENERQTELFCEWGHRFFDLKRTGTADQVLGVNKTPNWQSTDALYPLPLAEMQINPFLVQNAGY